MMYVSQIIMLYTLNLYSALYQLNLNITGRKIREQGKTDLERKINNGANTENFIKLSGKAFWHGSEPPTVYPFPFHKSTNFAM